MALQFFKLDDNMLRKSLLDSRLLNELRTESIYQIKVEGALNLFGYSRDI